MRRIVVGFVVALATTGALAQVDFPTKPIRIIVPYAPGGTDQQIRTLAPSLQKILGQTLVIENREGGGASIGANAVKMAVPDGYTLLYTGTGAFTVVPHIRKGVPYTLDDFVPIGNVTGTSFIVAARADAPFKTYAEFIAFARANPGKVNFGSAGLGTTTHMTGEVLQGAAGVQFTHVPFQGIGPAVRALIGSQIDIAIGLPSAIMPQVNGGKAVALASSGAVRSEFAPSAPTMREAGTDAVEITKFGLFAPKGVPEPVLARLTSALAEAVKSPDFTELAKKTFNTIYYLNPADYRKALDDESRYFRKLITDLKLSEQ